MQKRITRRLSQIVYDIKDIIKLKIYKLYKIKGSDQKSEPFKFMKDYYSLS